MILAGNASLFLLLLIIVESTLAADTVLGPRNAYLCFEESRWSKSIRGISYCDRAIADDKSLSKRDLAATYSNRGIIYSANSIYDLAIRDHNKAIAIRPLLAQAIVNLGNVYFRMGEYEKAIHRKGEVERIAVQLKRDEQMYRFKDYQFTWMSNTGKAHFKKPLTIIDKTSSRIKLLKLKLKR